MRYQLARAGLDSCHSPAHAVVATEDLLRLAQALDSQPDQAVASFTGIGAGILTSAQRDHLWNTYQVPLFEQFLKENIEVQSLLYFENQFSKIKNFISKSAENAFKNL